MGSSLIVGLVVCLVSRGQRIRGKTGKSLFKRRDLFRLLRNTDEKEKRMMYDEEMLFGIIGDILGVLYYLIPPWSEWSLTRCLFSLFFSFLWKVFGKMRVRKRRTTSDAYGMLTEVLACDNAVMLGMEPKPC